LDDGVFLKPLILFVRPSGLDTHDIYVGRRSMREFRVEACEATTMLKSKVW
jgi:hypothetical protein